MRINKFFATTVSLFLLLLIGGVASYLTLGGYAKSEAMLSDFRVGVYLADSLTKDQVYDIENLIKNDKVVAQVLFVSKADAAKEFEAQLGVKFNGDNPLPISMRVKLKKNSDVNAFIRKVKQIKGVESVDFPSQVVSEVKSNLRTIGLFVVGFGVVLALVILIIFRNVVRMDVAASSEAIAKAVQQRVPIGIIREPFLVRAFTSGAMAGGLASVFMLIITQGIAVMYPITKLDIDLSLMFVIFAVMMLAGMLLSWFFAYCAVGNQVEK